MAKLKTKSKVSLVKDMRKIPEGQWNSKDENKLTTQWLKKEKDQHTNNTTQSTVMQMSLSYRWKQVIYLEIHSIRGR